jgi:uncharacterized protein (TIGR03067 family)
LGILAQPLLSTRYSGSLNDLASSYNAGKGLVSMWTSVALLPFTCIKEWAMKAWLWLSVCGLLLAAPMGRAANEDAFDTSKMIGTWTFLAGEKNGEKADAEQLKQWSVIITKETLTLKSAEATFVMKYELDPKQNPATVTWTITESPFGAGATAKGIIGWDGDKLKVCYAQAGETPPKKFEAPKDSNCRLVVLKKAKSLWQN